MTIKRRFLLTGDYENNCGPCNVNRSLVMNADEAMDYVRAKSRLTKKIKRICKLLRYHTIVISGGLADMEVELARLLGKRIIYIMHGYSSYEYIINKLELPPVVLEREQRLLRYADKIVAVSANYAKWVKRQIPEYASKVTFVNNGLELVDNYPSPLR